MHTSHWATLFFIYIAEWVDSKEHNIWRTGCTVPIYYLDSDVKRQKREAARWYAV